MKKATLIMTIILNLVSACQTAPEEIKEPGVCIDSGDREIGLLFRPCDSTENDICRYRYLSGYYQASMWETMSFDDCMKLNNLKTGV